MPVVDITLGSRTFQLACGEGQEVHLRGLAESLDGRIKELSESFKTGNETLLLVMAALMTQDELNEIQKRPKPGEGNEAVDTAVAEALETVADYVEAIADRIKKA